MLCVDYPHLPLTQPKIQHQASIDDVRDRVCHALVRYSDTIKVRTCTQKDIRTPPAKTPIASAMWTK